MHISWTQLKKILHVYFKKVHDWFGVNDLSIKNFWSQTATGWGSIFLWMKLCQIVKLREFSKSDLNFKEKQEVWDAGDSVTLAREECPYPCDCVSLYVFRSPVSVISPAVVEAVCGCQLARAKEAEREAQSPSQAEHMVLDEFGHCLTQIVVAIFQNKAH